MCVSRSARGRSRPRASSSVCSQDCGPGSTITPSISQAQITFSRPRWRTSMGRIAQGRYGAGMSLEVITIGRISVDLYPEQVGVPLAEVASFARGLGGTPTNVGVAAARHGRRTAVITKVGDDPFGPYC